MYIYIYIHIHIYISLSLSLRARVQRPLGDHRFIHLIATNSSQRISLHCRGEARKLIEPRSEADYLSSVPRSIPRSEKDSGTKQIRGKHNKGSTLKHENYSRRDQYEISAHTHQDRGTLKTDSTMSHGF